MKKHNATVHQRKKAQSNSFECSICEKAFDQKGSLKKYKAAVHEEKKRLSKYNLKMDIQRLNIILEKSKMQSGQKYTTSFVQNFLEFFKV